MVAPYLLLLCSPVPGQLYPGTVSPRASAEPTLVPVGLGLDAMCSRADAQVRSRAGSAVMSKAACGTGVAAASSELGWPHSVVLLDPRAGGRQVLSETPSHHIHPVEFSPPSAKLDPAACSDLSGCSHSCAAGAPREDAVLQELRFLHVHCTTKGTDSQCHHFICPFSGTPIPFMDLYGPEREESILTPEAWWAQCSRRPLEDGAALPRPHCCRAAPGCCLLPCMDCLEQNPSIS